MDGANVIGAKADGWWRDRPAAARRLVTAIAAWLAGSAGGTRPPEPAERPAHVVVVLEGAARAGVPEGIVEAPPAPITAGEPETAAGNRGGAAIPTLTVSHATGHGDDAIVAAAGAAGPRPLVITSDRDLVRRVRAVGADTRGARWLWDHVGR